MIIENHSVYKLNDTFRSKHQNLLNKFTNENLNIEFCDNVLSFENFLKVLDLSEKSYPYDDTFSSNNIFVNDKNSYFLIYLKNHNEIVATYSVRKINPVGFLGNVKNYFQFKSYLTNPDDYLPTGKSFHSLENSYYSSNLWIKSIYQNKKIDIFLDHLKKNIIFDIFNGDLNFSVHRKKFTNYHINDLLYERSEWIGTVSDDSLIRGLTNTATNEDRNYNMTWVFKDTWQNKYNEINLSYL